MYFTSSRLIDELGAHLVADGPVDRDVAANHLDELTRDLGDPRTASQGADPSSSNEVNLRRA